MQNKQLNINFKTLIFVFIGSLLFSMILKLSVYAFIYDQKDIDYDIGEILISLKKIEVLYPDKIIEMDIIKRNFFNETPTYMVFKIDYSKEPIKQIENYYFKQAEMKQWQFEKNNDEIVLSKEYDENFIKLTLKPTQKNIWVLQAINQRKYKN